MKLEGLVSSAAQTEKAPSTLLPRIIWPNWM